MSGDSDPVEAGYDVTWTGSPSDGQDPLQTFAMTVLAVHRQARLSGGSAVVRHVVVAHTDDAGRATEITAHLELQATDPDSLAAAAGAVLRQARERADRDRTLLLVVGPHPIG